VSQQEDSQAIKHRNNICRWYGNINDRNGRAFSQSFRNLSLSLAVRELAPEAAKIFSDLVNRKAILREMVVVESP
jgi:hypothetical protein